MKTLFSILAFVLGTLAIQAQENCLTPELQSGDLLKISEPADGNAFKHINFPKSNFIIKRGGIANYRALINKQIEVTEVETANGCIAKLYVKRTDGKKFFNRLQVVSIDIQEALAAGEVAVL